MKFRVRSVKRVVIAIQLIIILYFVVGEIRDASTVPLNNVTGLNNAYVVIYSDNDTIGQPSQEDASVAQAAPGIVPNQPQVPAPGSVDAVAGVVPPPGAVPPPAVAAPSPQLAGQAPPAGAEASFAAPQLPVGSPGSQGPAEAEHHEEIQPLRADGGMDVPADISAYTASRHFSFSNPFPGLQSSVGEIPDEERNYMRVRYTPPPITEISYTGHKMKVLADHGRDVAELSNHLVRMTPDVLENFVFVTAASANHFEESRDAVASAQTQFPGKPILYFDLGLEQEQIEELKKWESVQYRWFNFSMYPGQFLVNIRRCAWKPFVIAEALKQYGGVFYMDSSIRIMSHDFSSAFRLASYNGGFVQFHASKYSIYGGTHEKLYAFFPTKKTLMKNMAMHAGGALLIYNTDDVYKNIMWYWSMCTLDKQCYIPTLEMNCDMHTYDKWKDYMHCHKFDTSILNILLSNLHGYDANKYLAPDGIITIEKIPTSHFRTKYRS